MTDEHIASRLPATKSLSSKAIVHGYPHLAIIRESLRTLYRCLSSSGIAAFGMSFSPHDARILPHEDITLGVHRVASALARHLRLPAGSIVINFRQMEVAGRVELTADDVYLVELHSRYQNDRRDIAAVLAHKITHVFLHRAGLGFDTVQEDELLTDTTAVYLGVGHLCLDAYRVTMTTRWNTSTIRKEKLGYLTPEEFGYVLGKRSLAFAENCPALITSPAAKKAFTEGFRRARLDHEQAPLAACSWLRRLGYYWNRSRVRSVCLGSGLKGLSRYFAGYQFAVAEEMRVILECPVCSQKLRLPVGMTLEARCGLCQAVLMCKT